jgi:hypothetical protein
MAAMTEDIRMWKLLTVALVALALVGAMTTYSMLTAESAIADPNGNGQ